MISIIIPTWNSADTIRATLESVFAQTFQDVEIIVVNDGSTDATDIILKSFGDRIAVINQKNAGSNVARNRGHAEANGEYLLFLDSDITLRSDCIEKLYKALITHPEVSYAYSSFLWERKLFKLWSFDAERLRRMPYIHTGALIRAKDFPGFDENLRRFQDWDLWLTMLEQGKIGVWIPEVLFMVAPREHGISQWVPRWTFWMPWRLLGWAPKRVRAYEIARAAIREKHKL